MIPWPRSRARCLHCALIALAIHGITPNARDVTSGSIPRILQSIGYDIGSGAADEATPGDDAPDEKPDEVCTPASATLGLATRGRVDGPSIAPGIPVARCMPGKGPPRSPFPREAATTCRRLASLCRFTC